MLSARGEIFQLIDPMLEMARVNIKYFREKLGVLQIEVSSKRK